MEQEKKILLTIVTYNRCTVLSRCLNAVRNQTFKDFDVLVIDNGSTDGTKEFLDSQNDIIVIHQGNLGGAGGFYTGQKYMYDHNYEWLWMMDDDGCPDPDQLGNLIHFADHSDERYLNALVLDIDDNSALAFGYMENWPQFDIEGLKNLGFLKGIHPFNGTFVHRSVITTIGFIKKEMFIWGDEQEYTRRAIAAGYVPTTVTSAIHYHPKEKGNFVVVLPYIWKRGLLVKPKSLSHIYYRNCGFINNKYNGHPWMDDEVKMNIVYRLRKFDFKELFKFIRYYRMGIKNIY